MKNNSGLMTSWAGILATLTIIAVFALAALQAVIFTIEDPTPNRFVIMAIACMVVAGLGLISLLSASQFMLERAVKQKAGFIEQLEQRIIAMDAAMDGIAILDPRGRIVYANTALATIYHTDKATLTGQKWTVLYDAAQVEWFERDVFPRLDDARHWHGNSIGRRMNGQTFSQDVTLTRLSDGGWIIIMRDVTDEKEAAELSDKRLAAIEAAGDGIGLVDPEGRLIYVNKAYRELHRLSEEEIKHYLGRSWTELYTEKGRAEIRDKVMPHLRKHGYWKGISAIVLNDGTITEAEMSLTLLPDGGLIGTAQDVSQRLQAEKEKDSLQKQVFQAQKMEAVGRLAGGIAHDFNNILSSIKGYSEFLIDDLPDGSEQKNFARQIMKGCRQARALVDQILTFSRSRETAKEVINLNDNIQDTVNMLLSTLPATVVLETDIQVEDAYIHANPVYISQTLMNLCVNAADAIEDDHGTVTIALDTVMGGSEPYQAMLADDLPQSGKLPPMQIETVNERDHVLMYGYLARDRDYVRLTVKDDGSGMSAETLSQIFEPFFTTKPIDEGTGLGLSTVHGIVSDHRGAMVVKSREGQGSEFILYFPLIKHADDRLGPQTGDGGVYATGTGRVLLVEDQPHVRHMLMRMIKRFGYQVDSCESGEDAIDHLRAHPGLYDVVISDQSMPRMLGSEMAGQIRDDFPDLPVILLSGYSREKLVAAMDKNPSIHAVMAKPVDRVELSQQIDSAIAKKAV